MISGKTSLLSILLPGKKPICPKVSICQWSPPGIVQLRQKMGKGTGAIYLVFLTCSLLLSLLSLFSTLLAFPKATTCQLDESRQQAWVLQVALTEGTWLPQYIPCIVFPFSISISPKCTQRVIACQFENSMDCSDFESLSATDAKYPYWSNDLPSS